MPHSWHRRSADPYAPPAAPNRAHAPPETPAQAWESSDALQLREESSSATTGNRPDHRLERITDGELGTKTTDCMSPMQNSSLGYILAAAGTSTTNENRVPCSSSVSTTSSLPIARISFWQIASPSPALEKA